MKESKVCRKCEVEKPLSEFYDNPQQSKDSYCKVCRIEYNRSRKDITNARRREKNSTGPKYRERVCRIRRESHRRKIETAMFNRAKRRARLKNLEFDIELPDIVIPEVCPILGIPIFCGKRGDYGNSPTIDRKDNSKGYTKGNIGIISMKANTMKNDLSIEELLRLSDVFRAYLTG